MTVTQSLARFIVGLNQPANIPDAVMEKARLCLMNGYGIALACFDTPYASVASRAALAIDGEQPQGATLLANGRKTSMLGATLANSALFHGRAQEDACGAAHLGAILIPLLTAAVEAGHMPIDRMLTALIAGYEAGGLLETNYAPATTPVGLRASALYGAIAAAASASFALNLTAAQTAAALANAASFAGGLLQSFEDGTDEWRYQLGIAARNGWVAAELARAGSVCAPRAIEGGKGFIKAYARKDCDVEALTGQIGKTWFIERVVFKPYPVCAFNQSPVNAALNLRARLDGKLPAQIQVRMNPYETGYAGMNSHGPFHSVSGTLMSIPFCIANTLLYGAPTMKKMMVFNDPAVQQLVDRINLIPDAGVQRLCCEIDVQFEDGSQAITESLKMTVADYNYAREPLRALILRVCAEVNVGPAAFEAIEKFADQPARTGIGAVLDCFAMLRNQASGTTL